MKIALYSRVSTSDKGQDPEMQLRELREYCQRREWSVAGAYVDCISGARDKRTELNRLMADAKQRRFDVVLVWKLDRFGRSLRHFQNPNSGASRAKEKLDQHPENYEEGQRSCCTSQEGRGVNAESTPQDEKAPVGRLRNHPTTFEGRLSIAAPCQWGQTAQNWIVTTYEAKIQTEERLMAIQKKSLRGTVKTTKKAKLAAAPAKNEGAKTKKIQSFSFGAGNP